MPDRGIYIVPTSHLERYRLGEREACLSRGAQVIARALRLMEAREDLHFFVGDKVLWAKEADLLERPAGDVDPNAVRFAPFEIKTIRLALGEGE